MAKRFRKGQTVWTSLSGARATTWEERTVLKVRGGYVWLDNGPGNDPTGPFDAETGRYLPHSLFGFTMQLFSEKPEEYED